MIDIKEYIALLDYKVCYTMFLYDESFKQHFKENTTMYKEKFVTECNSFNNTFIDYRINGKGACRKYVKDNVSIFYDINAYKIIVDNHRWEYDPPARQMKNEYKYVAYNKNNIDHVGIMNMFGLNRCHYKITQVVYIGNNIIGFYVGGIIDKFLDLIYIIDKIADRYIIGGNKSYLLDDLSKYVNNKKWCQNMLTIKNDVKIC